ncbi:MAG: acyltransferase [Verrucomicrobiota bacterium]
MIALISPVYRRFAKVASFLQGQLRLLHLRLKHGSALRMHRSVRIGSNVLISIRNGGRVEMGEGVLIRDGASLNANGGAILLGAGSFINRNSSINSQKSVELAANVLVGENAAIYDHDHLIEAGGTVARNTFTVDPVSIGEGAWICTGVVVLKGTRAGRNAVIAAGAIVKGEVEDNTILIQKRTSIFRKHASIPQG